MTIQELNLIANRIKLLFALKTELVQAGLTEAEVDARIAQYLIDNPQDTILTDEQVNTIIEAYFIANPPTDQVRTDVEINALIATYVQSHPAPVMTDAEVVALIEQEASAADQLTQAQVDAIIDSIGGAQNLGANNTDPFGDGSLVHFYPLDGSTTDLVSATDIVKVGGSYVTGKYSDGVMFNGTENSVLSIEDGLHTVSFWVKLSDTKEMNIADNRMAQPAGSGYLYSPAGGTSIVFTFPEVYVNGVLAASGNITVGTGWTHIVIANLEMTGLLLGNYYRDGAYTSKFDGLFDHIQAFNRALTQEEITQLFTATLDDGAGGAHSLDSADPFGDGSLDRAYLFEGNGDDLLGNNNLIITPKTGLSYVDGELVTDNTISESDLPDIGVGFSANTQFYATVKAGNASTQLFSFGNGNSGTRIYINASIGANGVPQVSIQFRNGASSGTYWYYNNTVVNPVAAGDKIGIYIEQYISNGTATRIYINGVLATQSVSNGDGATYTPAGTMHLGAITSNNSAYTKIPSRLDTLHFFNRSLTEAEITSLQP